LQKEPVRDVEPSIHGGKERLMHQVTKLFCTPNEPSKTSKHKYVNENQ